jgi:site-specific DNA recombinase
MESAWSNGKAAYRCRHDHTTASRPDLDRPENAYVRQDRIMPHLPALHLLLTRADRGGERRRRRTRGGADVRPRASTEDVIGHLRERQILLTYDPAAGTLLAGIAGAAQEAITLKAS